jgi:hypothetical protein
MLVLLDPGPLDAIGARLLADTVPPGASGHTVTVRAWSIGFAGRLVESQVAAIAFQ